MSKPLLTSRKRISLVEGIVPCICTVKKKRLSRVTRVDPDCGSTGDCLIQDDQRVALSHMSLWMNHSDN